MSQPGENAASAEAASRTSPTPLANSTAALFASPEHGGAAANRGTHHERSAIESLLADMSLRLAQVNDRLLAMERANDRTHGEHRGPEQHGEHRGPEQHGAPNLQNGSSLFTGNGGNRHITTSTHHATTIMLSQTPAAAYMQPPPVPQTYPTTSIPGPSYMQPPPVSQTYPTTSIPGPSLMYQRSYEENPAAHQTYQHAWPQTLLNQSQISARQGVSKDLPPFSGLAEEWPIFITSYENSTAICGYSAEENLLRLQKALKGKALEAVRNRLLHPSNLEGAISTLRTLFGRPEVIVHNMISKIRRLPRPTMLNFQTLIDFGVAVQNMCATIDAAGLDDYMCNVALLQELVDKLPPSIKLDWAFHKQAQQRTTLADFGVWLESLVSAASSVTLPTIEEPNHDGRQKEPNHRPKHFVNTHTPLEQVATGSKCVICTDRDCVPPVCKRFREMSINERWTAVRNHQLCKMCLMRHTRRKCSPVRCGIDGCTFAHHRYLHNAKGQEPTTSTRNMRQLDDQPCEDGKLEPTRAVCNAHQIDGQQVLLRYVPVIITAKGKSVETYAFLDDGSSATFIDKTLAAELGAEGQPRPMCLKWTDDRSREEPDSVELLLGISGVEPTAQQYVLQKVYTLSQLDLPPQSVSSVELAKRYKHLQGRTIASYDNVRPKLLIGMDNCHLGHPLDCVEGRAGEPAAFKTRLGWIPHGPHSPSAAQYVKNTNADRFSEQYPKAVDCIKTLHYVDDMLVSVDTEEEAIELCDEVKYIHTQGGFEITNWLSNSERVLSHLLRGEEHPTSPNEATPVHNPNAGRNTSKVLGMWWDTSADVFTYRRSPKHEEDLLSVLLQEIWRTKLEWDQELNDDLTKKWSAWIQLLPELHHVSVPRCYHSTLYRENATAQLHVFCHASENGMAAVAYFRFVAGDFIKCALIGSKTRVAPLPFISIPRLELQGTCGRLANCPWVDEATKRPIILPREHLVTDLIIDDTHRRYYHQGHQTAINALRSHYHIPRLRVEFNRVRKQCQRCKNRDVRPEPPLMGNIPEQRLAAFRPPFSYTGIDYFGPLTVAVGRRTEKHTLNTTSCILAIRRFIARRGKPIELISDCGTNFIGASRELKDALKEVDSSRLMEDTAPNLRWVFNPPGAPHFGGSWERLIGSVKKALLEMRLPRLPTDEVLQTALAEVEYTVNSRPLTDVPIDFDSEPPLTPNHFLLGSFNGDKPHLPFDNKAATLKTSWLTSQRLADVFWGKWVREYLPTLTRRSKWVKRARPIAVGDVVVIADENLPRNHWPRGTVAAVVLARDGQVRRVTIRAPNGQIYERPATKIAVLDVKPRIEGTDS